MSCYFIRCVGRAKKLRRGGQVVSITAKHGEIPGLDQAEAVYLDINTLSKTVRCLDELGKVSGFFQVDPMVNASERLVLRVRVRVRVREVLNMT